MSPNFKKLATRAFSALSQITSLKPSFPLFPLLPLEIRLKIWQATFPGPRVLHIIRGYLSSHGYFIVTSASYGGRHPAILSINRESRTEALRVLRPHLGAYWNLEIDAPYFEDNRDGHAWVHEGSELVMEMERRRFLNVFRNIALDCNMWEWLKPGSVYADVSCRKAAILLSSLPNIKKCTFVYTDHISSIDIVTPYLPWTLGRMNIKTTLSDRYQRRQIEIRRAIEQARTEHSLGVGTEISVAAIHGRARRRVKDDKLKRQRDQSERDFFG